MVLYKKRQKVSLYDIFLDFVWSRGQGFFSIELYKFNAYNLITKVNKFMFIIFKVIL